MNTNNSFRQFVKDGLVGVAVALAIFVVLPSDYKSFVDFYELLGNPMPFILLTAFVGSGAGGHFLENVSSNMGWAKSLLAISMISLLAEVVSFVVAYFLSIGGWGVMLGGFFISSFGFVGGLIGSLIGYIVGVKFNPSKRFYRVILGAITSSIVGYGGGFGIVGLFRIT